MKYHRDDGEPLRSLTYMGGEVKIGLLQVKRKRRPFPAGRDRKASDV